MSRRRLNSLLIHFFGQAADQGQSNVAPLADAPPEVAPPIEDEEREEINKAIVYLANKIRSIG